MHNGFFIPHLFLLLKACPDFVPLYITLLPCAGEDFIWFHLAWSAHCSDQSAMFLICDGAAESKHFALLLLLNKFSTASIILMFSDAYLYYRGRQARILHSDLGATNGVVHIIDRVIFVQEDVYATTSEAHIFSSSTIMCTLCILGLHVIYFFLRFFR